MPPPRPRRLAVTGLGQCADVLENVQREGRRRQARIRRCTVMLEIVACRQLLPPISRDGWGGQLVRLIRVKLKCRRFALYRFGTTFGDERPRYQATSAAPAPEEMRPEVTPPRGLDEGYVRRTDETASSASLVFASERTLSRRDMDFIYELGAPTSIDVEAIWRPKTHRSTLLRHLKLHWRQPSSLPADGRRSNSLRMSAIARISAFFLIV
jgi:hypothetical protein